MSTLKSYREKRKFSSTPEPSGKKKTGKSSRRFVIQKHAASHLHYDFRLELNGVLKSWAVPKGPSLNPNDKRLAIMVEDHPYEYRTFEGTIPTGNYGAGTVMVWDEGTYHAFPDDSPRAVAAALKAGKLEIILTGHKLNGAYTLVRLKTDDRSWLLIKKKDAFAQSDLTAVSDRSVITNRTMEEITSGRSKRSSKRPQERMPHDIKPMLCTLVDQPFNDAEWLFEIKWDGYRAIAEVKDSEVKLYSRNLKPFNDMFPSIVEALKHIDATAIFDGEIVLLDKAGKPHFQLLQNYQKTREGTPIYYIFDLLYLDGQDLRRTPLIDRKNLLKELLQKYPQNVIRFSDHIIQEGTRFFKATAINGLEGIIAKYGQSHYEHRRSREWLKIKTSLRQEAIICGFTAPQKSRKHFGALILGVYQDKKLIPIGRVGTGFSERILKDIHETLVPLIVKKCPFVNPPDKSLADVTWVRPKLICEINFTEWTDEGSMRHPSFVGLRTDKNAKKVVRELPS